MSDFRSRFRAVWTLALAGALGCSDSVVDSAEPRHEGSVPVDSAEAAVATSESADSETPAASPPSGSSPPAPSAAATAPPDPTKQDAPPADPDRPLPPIVFLSLDTLRADRMSLYGNPAPTTPHLEELAKQATVYTRAQATAPWTLPSHASMFTGLYPFEHGARTYARSEIPEGVKGNVGSLSYDFTTLSEVLQQRGYQTIGYTANEAYLNDRYAIHQGFDVYQNEKGRVDEINQRVFGWLRRHQDDEEPFFLFVNYMDCHRPYNCVAREGFPDLGTPRDSGRMLKGMYGPVLDPDQEPDPEQIARLIGQYDIALANLDDGVGRLFQRLKEYGWYEDALIVVTSDHGEYFGEHHLIEHSKDVYQGAMRVPLIVKAPGQQEPARDDEWISHVHIPGLIAAALGLDPQEGRYAMLTRHWPRDSILAENYFSRLHDINSPFGMRFRRVRRVLYHDRYKYISSSDGENELYDLTADPDELSNLLMEQSTIGRAMARKLEAMTPEDRQSDASVPDVEFTEEELETLRALGYLGDDD